MHRHFYLLGLNTNATIDEVKKAYRHLAKEFHPDVNSGVDAQKKFIEITAAYEAILDKFNTSNSEINTDQEEANYRETLKQWRESNKRKAQANKELKLKREEAYLQSGLADLILIITIILRVAIFPIIGALITMPFILCYLFGYTLLFTLLFFAPFAFILSWYVKSNWSNYFIPDKFYYNFTKIKSFFNQQASNTNNLACYFTNNQLANGLPNKIVLQKIVNIKLNNVGPMQHYAKFDQVYSEIIEPRSQKAFNYHFIATLIKICILLAILLYAPTKSLWWNFVAGICIASGCARLFLKFVKTLPSNLYFITWGFVLKCAVWLITGAFFTNFSTTFSNIYTYENIFPAFTILLFIDPFIEWFGLRWLNYPLFKQPQQIYTLYKQGYQTYMHIPLWTLVYPFFKWLWI